MSNIRRPSGHLSAELQCSHRRPINNAMPDACGVIAHRGLCLNAEENSWRSFTHLVMANRRGVPLSVEFDIRSTKDDALVICHEDHFRGVPLAEVTYAELAHRFGPSRPPLLEDVIDLLVGENIPLLNAEVKEWRNIDRVFALLDGWASEHVLVSSFLPQVLRYAHEHSDFETGLLLLHEDEDPWNREMTERLRKLDVCEADVLIPHFSQISPDLAREVRQRGKGLSTWTVNDVVELRTWSDGGLVDFVVTDEPQVLLPQLKAVTRPEEALAAN